MPYFNYEGEVDVDIDDFLTACDSSDIKDLIKALVEDGYLPNSVLTSSGSSTGSCVSEMEYEDALDKLHGKWSVLSKEEEEVIIKVSKRF